MFGLDTKTLNTELKKQGLVMSGEGMREEFEEYECDLRELKVFKLEELRTAVEEGSSWWVREILDECMSRDGPYIREAGLIFRKVKPLFDVEKDLVPVLEEAMIWGQAEIAREIMRAIQKNEMNMHC